MSPRIALSVAACCAAALACARPAAAQTDSTAATASVEISQPQAALRGNRNLLTVQDIEARHAPNAYELIRALRPGWLRGARGASGLRGAQVVVYRDGMRMGGPSVLRDINPESISEIRFFDATDATQRWGTDHGAGAIFVTTR